MTVRAAPVGLGKEHDTAAVRNRLVAFAAIAYVASTALGVVMRFELLGLNTGIAFDHLLHAHSHTLYFGWAGLAVLVAASDLLPSRSRPLNWATIGIAVLMPPTFVGFLLLGYHAVTIAISTAVMLLWYVAAASWWRSARTLDGTAVRILRIAFAYLVASSFGVWVLAGLQATGAGTPFGESLSVHAFLVGFAWFLVLGVVGLLVARLNVRSDEASVARAAWWWLPLAWLTFPLGVANGPEVAWLGPAARIAGVLLLYPAWLWVRWLWRAAPGKDRPWLWRTIAGWFALTACGLASVGVIGTPALASGGRQGVVIYLHALLVGFVTTALVMLIARTTRGLQAHTVSLAVMLAGLAAVATGWTSAGSAIGAWAAVALWLAGIAWSIPLVQKGLRPGAAPDS